MSRRVGEECFTFHDTEYPLCVTDCVTFSFQELSLKIEHLTEDSGKKRRQLDNETTETLTAQIELDKTAEEFRKAHADRKQLIDQWEHTIEQMQRRDEEMDLMAIVSLRWRVKQLRNTCTCSFLPDFHKHF